MTRIAGGTDAEIVGSNLGALYLVQAINSVAPLIVIPYLTRVLSPAGYGSLAFFQSLIAYGVVVLNFGFYVSGIRDAARYRADRRLLAKKFKEIIATKCLLLGSLLVVMVVASATVPIIRADKLLFFICGLQLVGNVMLPTWLYQGVEQARKVVGPQLLARLVTTAAIFLLVHSRADLVVAAGLLASSDILCGVLLWNSVRKLVDFRGVVIHWVDVKRTIIEDISLFGISVGSNLYTAFNPMIIEIFYGRVEVAYYAIAFRIASAVTKVTGPLIQAVSPKLAVLVIKDRPEAVRMLIKSGILLLAISGGFAILMFSIPQMLMHLVAGGAYVSGARVLEAFAPLSALMVMGALVGQNFAVHMGLGRIIARMYWVIGVVDLAAMVPMTKTFGAVGSAVTVVAAEVLLVFIMILLVLRRIGLHESAVQ